MDDKLIDEIKDKKVMVYGESLGIALLQYVKTENLLVITTSESGEYLKKSVKSFHCDIEKKANLSMSIMMNALEKKFDVKHEYKIM